MKKSTTIVKIDAKGRAIGRVASEAAKALRGKMTPAFEPNQVPDIKVEIVNASGAKVTAKKARQTTFRHYTGYPGGLREETLASLAKRKGYAAVFERAVKGMLPANRLRSVLLKNLVVKE